MSLHAGHMAVVDRRQSGKLEISLATEHEDSAPLATIFLDTAVKVQKWREIRSRHLARTPFPSRARSFQFHFLKLLERVFSIFYSVLAFKLAFARPVLHPGPSQTQTRR